ncbi:tetratricopeptide repeat protein [Streptomyces phaeochromogenes]|uniref:CHAT domain-containing tetratricopeptide repeat protein n=1 Tax=Streptomyces phaeochromogenes TaxID=1923 RepID=UPI00386B4F3A|nr:tetratricopeptide repeat protein [Streptomyces phaeochromogenes]
MRQSDDQRLEECLAAFEARDYISCHQAAIRDPLPTDIQEQPVLLHLSAICLQRLGQLDDPDELRRLMLDVVSASPWEQFLVQLTFGHTPLDTVMRAAGDEQQRCQATYYAGARLLTAGRLAEAEELLRGCASSSVHCVERRLAEIELAAMSGPGTASEPAEQAFQAFLARAQSAVRQGRYQAGVRAAEEACDLARRSWGPDSVHLARGMAVLLIALAHSGHVRDAAELAQHALALGREHFGDEDPEFANLLNTVAYAHKSLSELEQASRLYQAAVGIWARSPEHRLEHAVALNNMAQIEVEREDLDRAEELFRCVLEMLDGLDDDIGLQAGVVNNLALVLTTKRDFDGAERLHRQALDHRREQFGQDHPQYAASLNNLAHVYKDQGRFADAEPLFRRAANILEQAHGIHHPHTMMTLNSLLEIYQATGQQEAAERVVVHVRSTQPSGPINRSHILHLLPDLTPLFQLLVSQIPELAHEPEVAGGPLDWKSPSYQRMVAELADDFTEGQYGACLRLALRLNAQETTHEVLQIWLMCSGQSLESTTGPAQGPDREHPSALFQLLITDPWYSALVGLTLGRVSPTDIEQWADSDERRCQLRYYTAHRKMADGHMDEALSNLASATTVGAECFEAWMAERLVRSPRRAADRLLAARVRDLNATASDGLSRKDFESAIPAAEEAWRLAAGLEERSTERTLSHYNIAMAAYSTGDRHRAETLLQELLTITRGAEYYDRTLVAGALNALGIIHTDLARFDGAEPALLDALEELRLAREEDGAFYAQVQHNLASLYEEMDDLPRAIRVGNEALENKRSKLGRNHPEYARTLSNLGTVYAKLGELQTAEELLTQAQRIRQAVLPPDHADLSVSARALAHVYVEQRRYDEAQSQARTALQIDRSTYGPESLGQATGQALLAHVCMMTSKPDEARRHLEESRTILERVVGTVHPYSIAVTTNLAVLQALEGDLRGALRLTGEVERTTSRLLFDVFATASERQRLQLLGTAHHRLSVMLSLVAALDAPDEEVAGAFEIILRRKGVVSEAQGAFRDETYEGASTELQAKINHVRLLREKIARKTLSGPGAEGSDAHVETLADWAEEKERLEAELARVTPGTGLERRMQDLNAELVRSLLPEGSALVEIVRFRLLNFTLASSDGNSPGAGYRYWAFVLRPAPHEGLRLVDLGDGDEIDRLIATYSEAISGADSDRDVTPRPTTVVRKAELKAGGELRAAVFDVLRPALGDARRLFLCPDGDLSRLPWEVLPHSAERRLIDDYRISYLGVGRDLLRAAAPSTGHSTAPVVVADPEFDLAIDGTVPPEPSDAPPDVCARALRTQGLRFARLPGTRREGMAVAALLGVEPILGAAATEAKVKSCRGPAILHIATHGFFLPDPESAHQQTSPLMSAATVGEPMFGRLSHAQESPLLRSGLVLAGVNTWLDGEVLPTDAEDGILTAEDVSGMDLVGTELVVLSACQTGLGCQHLGEGVMGLRRAFSQAGARTVVMSLWPVPDTETQTLMTDFYRRVQEGEERAVALRNAQLELRKQRPAPYWWGAFVCHGDPGSLAIS